MRDGLLASAGGSRPFLVDYLLILADLILLSAVGAALNFGPAGRQWNDRLSSPWGADGAAFLTAVAPVATHFAWSEASSFGATWASDGSV